MTAATIIVHPEPGELCSCGRPAVEVILTDRWGRVGWCGGFIPPGGHEFEREVVDRQPVMRCAVCGLIWWPDERAPKQTCKQRLAAEARRRGRW